MKISVVLPSYNAEAHLEKTLHALSTQNFTGDYEIIVVDCSEKDTVKNICVNFSKVKFHHESERFNPGIGRNIGAKLALGDLLVFVDTDVILDSGALDAAWTYYSAGHKIFGGALELNTDAEPDIASYLEHYFFNSESQKLRAECPRNNLSSALMLFDKTIFLEQGGFKNIPRMQDTELTERMIKLGFSLRFCPQVLGYQIQDSPLHKVLRKIYINGKNLFFIRYQSFSPERQTLLFVLLPLLTGFKMSRIIGRHLRYLPLRSRLRVLILSPLLALAGFYWMCGLYHSMICGGEISSKRD